MKKQSIMWRYIDQEQAILERLLHLPQTGRTAEALTGIGAVYFVAHGSSYNAALVVSDFLARNAGCRVYVYTPANFLYNGTSLSYEAPDRTLVIAISQTGTSRGVLEAAEMAKRLGFPLLSLTNAADSPLAAMADYSLPLDCGEEDSNAKTKGYSATLMQLLLLAIHLGLKKQVISEETFNEIFSELGESVSALPALTEQLCRWCEKSTFWRDITDIYVLGYGMNFGTAMEGQLKLMETLCIPTMFNDIEEFSHGMHRSITLDSTVILMDSGGALSALTQKTFQYLITKAGHVILLNASGNPLEDPSAVSIPRLRHTESVLLLTLAVQILSVFAPEYNEQDPNRDANNDYTQFAHTRV